jgi:hypothetical protein
MRRLALAAALLVAGCAHLPAVPAGRITEPELDAILRAPGRACTLTRAACDASIERAAETLRRIEAGEMTVERVDASCGPAAHESSESPR